MSIIHKSIKLISKRSERGHTVMRLCCTRRSMRCKRMSMVYSGWPWMPIMWSPYLNISILVFSDHPITSAFNGSSRTCRIFRTSHRTESSSWEILMCNRVYLTNIRTSSRWHSIIDSVDGIFNDDKAFELDCDTCMALIPMSHPETALPVFPPNARHKTYARQSSTLRYYIF